MLQASPSPSPSAPTSPSPAASFFARLQAGPTRSLSYDSGSSSELSATGHGDHLSSAAPGAVQSAAVVGPYSFSGNGGGSSDLRRAQSLRNPSTFTASRSRDLAGLASFTAAGSDLAASPAMSASSSSHYTPPLAARHPLFSHHALPPNSGVFASATGAVGPGSVPLEASPSYLSDPGPSGPPSPTGSNLSSGAFSPASAFLSHFSSTASLRPAINLAPDAQGARVLDYTLGKLLGRGGFSTVRQAIHVRTGEVLACKIVKRDDLSDTSGSLERFEDEIRLWKSLPRHKSLLPLLEMHRTPFATFLITPFLSGGSLLDVLRRDGGSENTARKWFPGVVAAVSAMHEGFADFDGGMLHGDLKLDNFLVDHAGDVMVGDFGMAQKIAGKGVEPVSTVPPPISAKFPAHLHARPRHSSPLPASNTHHLSSNKRSSRSPHRSHPDSSSGERTPHPSQPFPSASLPYAPPELLCAPPSAPTLAQDIWALGVILHALLTGRLPFVDAFDPRLQMKILRGAWDQPTHLGAEWLEALHGCLDGNKQSRWDIRRVRECDAVTGWREVKPRLKSRSRSRARGGGGGGGEKSPFDISLRSGSETPSSSSQPVAIKGRGRSRSRDTQRVRGSSYPSTGPVSDLFTPLGGMPEEDVRQTGPGGRPAFDSTRSRSVSASRSRSSGTGGHHTVFQLDEIHFNRPSNRGPSLRDDEGLVNDLEGVTITRGRSTYRPGLGNRSPSANPSLSVPGMTMLDGRDQRRSPSTSTSARRTPSYGPPSPDSRQSRSRTRWPDHASSSSAPPSQAPSRGRSGSRHGTGMGQVQDGLTAAAVVASRPPTMGVELDVVNEEGRRGRQQVMRGGGGRSGPGGSRSGSGRSKSRGQSVKNES